MITMLVAKLKRPIYGPDGLVLTDPTYVEAKHMPEDSPERGLLEQFTTLLGEEIVVMVLFPGGWAGKKPPADDVTERVSNFLALHQEKSVVLGGATACNFFGPKIYSTYLGTATVDYGVALYPAPHYEDLINSDNVSVGDLALALIKSQKCNRS